MSEVENLIVGAFPDSASLDSAVRIDMNSVENKRDGDDVVVGGFMQLFANGEFQFVINEYIGLDEATPVTDEALALRLSNFSVIREMKTKHLRYMLIRGTDWWGQLRLSSKFLEVHLGAESMERCDEALASLVTAFKSDGKKEDEVVYRVLSEYEGPTVARTKAIKWDDIKQNYPESTRNELEKLVTYRRELNSPDPRLVVMQGTPGVGKTWFERALMNEWQEWADFAVVADPESLFGNGGTSYFLKMVETAPRDRTRVLVIEDAPDSVVAGVRSGGLGRLLGLSDGLVACDRSIMVLLSTNTSLSELDPALIRNGRALHKVKFEKFPTTEASIRLGEFGPATTEMSLADIYVRIGETKSLSKEEHISIGTYL